MQTVKLYGELAQRFGPEHSFAIGSPAEAIRALEANYPGFSHHMIESGERGVGYRVIVDEMPLAQAGDLALPCSAKQPIKIVPVLHGGKSKFLGILLGAALIAAAFFVPQVTLFTIGTGASATTITLGGVLFNIGTSLLLSGVSAALTKAPKAGKVGTQQPNYLFDGPLNTTGQGNPVPVGYGQAIVGSQVISAGLYAKEVPVT